MLTAIPTSSQSTAWRNARLVRLLKDSVTAHAIRPAVILSRPVGVVPSFCRSLAQVATAVMAATPIRPAGG